MKRERGTSIRQIVTATGLSKSTTQRFFDGTSHNMTIATLASIADALECDLYVTMNPRGSVARWLEERRTCASET